MIEMLRQSHSAFGRAYRMNIGRFLFWAVLASGGVFVLYAVSGVHDVLSWRFGLRNILISILSLFLAESGSGRFLKDPLWRVPLFLFYLYALTIPVILSVSSDMSNVQVEATNSYFQMGLGMMWYDEDYFTLGLYIDNFVGTYGGETTFSWGDMADSLSVGASVYLPRFDRAGDLNLVRPFLTLQFGDVASSASYILASFELRFQLLPRYDVSLTASLLSFRDANVSYMRSTRNLTLFSLEFLLDNWTISASAEIPFSYYTGNSGQDSFALSIGLRYKPS